jgi:curved DNA-binding protein CbpA
MEFKDYYVVIDVSPDATPEEIKRAYRKLARKTHPDLKAGPEAEGAFKEINEPYEVLKDPGTRARYDEKRRGGPRRQGTSQDWDGGFRLCLAIRKRRHGSRISFRRFFWRQRSVRAGWSDGWRHPRARVP